MIFEKYVNSFQDFLATITNSGRTVENYLNTARRFISFIEEHYPRIKAIESITKEVIQDYQNFLTNHKTAKGTMLSNSTISNTLTGLKGFFRYLAENDMILSDPMKGITLPKRENTIIRNILSEREMRSLLDSLKTMTPFQIRNRAVIELLYSTGMRTSELCNLKITEIDLKEAVVSIINGKGNKSRLAPLGQYAVEYILLYLEKARKYFLKGKRTDPGNLFLSNRGVPFNRSTLNKCVIASVMNKTGIQKHISAYSFRHSVATILLGNKVDIMYIAKLLGHESLNTTQRYTRVEISDLKRVHSLTHPREKCSGPP